MRFGRLRTQRQQDQRDGDHISGDRHTNYCKECRPPRTIPAKDMIQTHELTKHFNGRPVVRGLSFTAPDGAITGLLGANGAGKTTTLRMICGVLQPESGSVTLDDAGADADAAATGDPLVPQRRLG